MAGRSMHSSVQLQTLASNIPFSPPPRHNQTTHFFPHLIRISFVAETIYIIVMCAWRNLRGCLCSCFVLICLFVSPHCWARGPSIIHYCKIEQDITNGDIKTFKSPQNLKKGAVSIDIFQSQGIGKDKLRKSLLNTIDSKTPF